MNRNILIQRTVINKDVDKRLFLLGLPKGSPSLKMPLVTFVLVFCVQSQIAVWALKRMRMISEHWFLSPQDGIFLSAIVLIVFRKH